MFNAIQENMEDINRIKVVLAEKKRTNRWLAEELGKDPATVGKVIFSKRIEICQE